MLAAAVSKQQSLVHRGRQEAVWQREASNFLLARPGFLGMEALRCLLRCCGWVLGVLNNLCPSYAQAIHMLVTTPSFNHRAMSESIRNRIPRTHTSRPHTCSRPLPALGTRARTPPGSPIHRAKPSASGTSPEDRVPTDQTVTSSPALPRQCPHPQGSQEDGRTHIRSEDQGAFYGMALGGSSTLFGPCKPANPVRMRFRGVCTASCRRALARTSWLWPRTGDCATSQHRSPGTAPPEPLASPSQWGAQAYNPHGRSGQA